MSPLPHNCHASYVCYMKPHYYDHHDGGADLKHCSFYLSSIYVRNLTGGDHLNTSTDILSRLGIRRYKEMT